MSIQGSINSMFNTVLGSVAAYKVSKQKKAEALAKADAQQKQEEQKAMDKYANEQVALANQRKQSIANRTKAAKETRWKNNVLKALNAISMQQANQIAAQRGVQQVEQRNALQQRFEQTDNIDKEKTDLGE